MEASESSVVETPTEPVSGEALDIPIGPPESSVAPIAAVNTERVTPETPQVEPTPEPEALGVAQGRIELSTGKQHDIQDIRSLQGLAVQAGSEFMELMRVDGKPIKVATNHIVSYE